MLNRSESARARTRTEAAIALGLLVLLTTGCGKQKVSKASRYVAAAHSVRVRIQDKGAGNRTAEIVCPDRARVTADTSGGRLEVVAVGTRVVARTGESRWINVPMSFVNAPAICAGSPWNRNAEGLAGALDSMVKLVVTELPIDPRELEGVKCQDWQVRERGFDPKGTNPSILLCLALDDQRPLQLSLPDGGTWAFSHWNEPLDISIPPDAPPES